MPQVFCTDHLLNSLVREIVALYYQSLNAVRLIALLKSTYV